MAKLRKAKKSKDVKAPSFDIEAFKRSFNSLDPQNMGTWPVIVKLTIAVFIAGLIGLLAYMLPIRSKISDIQASEKKEVTLLEQYREKESKARNLAAYKQQILQMESTFAQLLDQLPKETRIPDLVEDINMKGVGSGVEFRDISVDSEITRELFIEQPIKIEAKGDYHEFGHFISGVAGLSRIITLHNFSIENKNGNNFNEIPDLELKLDAKTYRAKASSKKQSDENEGSKS